MYDHVVVILKYILNFIPNKFINISGLIFLLNPLIPIIILAIILYCFILNSIPSVNNLWYYEF